MSMLEPTEAAERIMGTMSYLNSWLLEKSLSPKPIVVPYNSKFSQTRTVYTTLQMPMARRSYFKIMASHFNIRVSTMIVSAIRHYSDLEKLVEEKVRNFSPSPHTAEYLSQVFTSRRGEHSLDSLSETF
jgi:hypothetical protein